MKLENQVCSLELAKKLKELGAKQESAFYWGETSGLITEEEYLDFEDFASSIGKPQGTRVERHFPAYTATELGEMLPLHVEIKGSLLWFETRSNHKKNWVVAYCDDDDCVAEHSETEADARALMLIYLLENNLITL